MKLTGTFIVKAIKRKTQAKFFKDLKVGDTFTLEYSLSGSYGYAPDIGIYVDGKRVRTNSALQLRNNLDNFDVEEVS